MLKLRIWLLRNWIYYVLIVITLICTCYRLSFPKFSKIDASRKLIGTIVDITYESEEVWLLISVSNREKIKARYDIKDLENFSYQYGDVIVFQGEELLIPRASIPYGYDYQKNLALQNIFHQVELKEIKKVKSNLLIVKNFVYHRLLSLNSSRKYVTTFILGKNQLDSMFKYQLQNLGISHLFAISGMHISLLCGGLLWLLKRLSLKEGYRYFFMILFLLLFFYLTNYTPSLLRSGIFTIFLSLNKYFYFHIKGVNLLLFSLTFILWFYPSYLFSPALQFSFTTSFYLVLCQDKLKEGNYFTRLLKTSFISYFASLPIVLYYSGSSNILAIFYNLLFVPIVSFILFPLCLLTFCFPILDPICTLVIHLFEQLVHLCSRIPIGEIIIGRIPFWMIFLYFVFLILALSHKKKYFLFSFLLLLGKYFYVDSSVYVLMIDINQGDCFLFHDGRENILLDTGGNSFSKNPIGLYKTLPLLKKLGIKKLDHMILSHGDDDHLGDALFLLKNYPVKNVWINQGSINQKEKQLVNWYHAKIVNQDFILKTKHMMWQQLNKAFADENDSSLVFLISSFSKFLLFMGDASIKTEEYLLSTYSLPKIDILKLGHHGSKTSTSSNLLEKISPKLALISAGLNNRFSHPHQEVLSRLKEYNIPYFLTSEVGSVKINLKTGTITFYLS